MTVQEFLDSIDPVKENWKTTSPGHWTNTATGAKYDSTDVVQATINAYNAAQKAAGRAPYIPGITPVPDAFKTTPPTTGGSRPPLDFDHNSRDDLPRGVIPPGGSGVQPTGPGLGGLGRTNYIPGGSWRNPTGPGGGTAPGGTTSAAGPMRWNEPVSSGTGGPYETGQVMPFTPWGAIQGYSSEILRYGGKPNSGEGGSWAAGAGAPSPMQELFKPAAPKPGTAAGPMDPLLPYTQQTRSPDGGAYQNITISADDGKTWRDPRTGQDYVWKNGRWEKADLTNRLPERMVPPEERVEVSPGIYDGRPPYSGGAT